jgi:hypothetical protein
MDEPIVVLDESVVFVEVFSDSMSVDSLVVSELLSMELEVYVSKEDASCVATS